MRAQEGGEQGGREGETLCWKKRGMKEDRVWRNPGLSDTAWCVGWDLGEQVDTGTVRQ